MHKSASELKSVGPNCSRLLCESNILTNVSFLSFCFFFHLIYRKQISNMHTSSNLNIALIIISKIDSRNNLQSLNIIVPYITIDHRLTFERFHYQINYRIILLEFKNVIYIYPC